MEPSDVDRLRVSQTRVRWARADSGSSRTGSQCSGPTSVRISSSYDLSSRPSGASDGSNCKSLGRGSMVLTPSFEKRSFYRKSSTQEELRSKLSLMMGKEIEVTPSDENIFEDPTPQILRVSSKERMSFFVPGETTNKFERKKDNFFWEMIRSQNKKRMMGKTLQKMRHGTAVEQAFALTACSDRFLTIEERLAKMRIIFEAAKMDGQTGLDFEQFKRVSQRKVETGKENTDEEVRILFMKIDANTDGIIQWEEFVTFSLLQYRERARMIEQARMRPFPHEMIEIKSSHYSQIVKVLFIPQWSKSATTVDEENGRYALLSMDGMLTLWTMDMKCQQTHNMQDYAERIVPSMYLTNELKRRYHFINLECVITAMTCWSNIKTRDEAILVWGDMHGDIWSIVFNTMEHSDIFYRPGQQKVINESVDVKFVDVQQKCHPSIKLYHLTSVHTSFVQRVVYIEELEGFLSCSHSGRTSLYFGDIRGKWHKSYFTLSRGILCLEYSEKLNLFATGGIDHTLRLWNPYARKKAVAILEGFAKPVMQVGFHNRKDLVIGIDTSNQILVFHTYDYNCLQSIHGSALRMGKFSISASFFNQVQEHLIICTSSVGVLTTCDVETRKIEAPAHRKTVVAALYNKTFGLMVSGCHLSAIHIWDAQTGEKLIDFQNAHSIKQDGNDIPVQITCMTFDDQERRLLTGARDGSVKLWNLHVGLLLGELDVIDKQLVTCIVSTTSWIFVAGWGRRVIEYPDLQNLESRLRIWPRYHAEDILCMVMIGKIYLVTGSYDGDIVICSRETAKAVARMNAFQGVGVYGAFPHPKPPDLAPRSPNPPKTPTPGKKNINQAADDEVGAFDVDMAMLGLPAKFDFSPSTDSPELTDKHREPVTSTVRDSRGQNVNVEDYDKMAQKFEAAVEHILVLETRLSRMYDPCTAVLLAGGAEGWCRAWSLAGGLLGQFNVTTVSGDSISRMLLAEEDEYLITADTLGYIKMWDIKDYCTSEKTPKEQREKRKKYHMFMFPYLHITDSSRLEKVIMQTTYNLRRPPPLRSLPSKTLFSPLMVNQFRAHADPINWVEYIPDRRLIITAAKCSIRVWTFSGRYVSSFGNKWETLPDSPNPVQPSHVPRDIKRCGSPRTQRVVKGDVIDYWVHVVSYFRAQLGMEKSPFMQGQPYPEDLYLDEHISKYWLPNLKPRKMNTKKHKQVVEMIDDVTPSTPPVDPVEDRQTAIDPILEMMEKARKDRLNDKLDDARWRFRMKPIELVKAEIAAFKEGSDILGKSYKRLRHHRPMPKLSPLPMAGRKVLVYHTLNTNDLEPTLKKPEPPPIVSEINRINDILLSFKLNKRKTKNV